MASPKKKPYKSSARQLANLRPNPQHLKRGGKTAVKQLSLVQLDFCSKVAAGLTYYQASVECGVSWGQGYNWAHRSEVVRKQIDEFKEQFKALVLQGTKKTIEMRTEFADHHAIRLIQKAKKADVAVAKLIHSSWQRTGAIKTSSVSASATANAAAGIIAGGTMEEIYKARWLREKEARMAATFESEYAGKVLESQDSQ